MSKQEIYKKARDNFDEYIATSTETNTDHLNKVQKLQYALAVWVNSELTSDSTTDTLGVSEEVGETTEAMLLLLLLATKSGKLSHAILKHHQGIREHHEQNIEKLRAEVADGVIDVIIYAMNLCTHQRLDFDTLLRETITEVTTRKWKTDPQGKQY